jgi:hypothetical protein
MRILTCSLDASRKFALRYVVVVVLSVVCVGILFGEQDGPWSYPQGH